MRQASALYGMRAMSAVHVGCENLGGAVDLIVQREKHTQWPVLFASSVKGALRDCARKQWSLDAEGEKWLEALFGPRDPGRKQHRAGALLVGDARLLALPVPSLDHVFYWVCCPQALRRLARDCAMYQQARPLQDALQACQPWLASAFAGERANHAYSLGQPSGAHVFLLEYAFMREMCAAPGLASALAALFGIPAQEFEQQLLLVSDAHFALLGQTATSVQPHIRLNENKVTQDGALWYEESLLPETLMYLPLACETERLSQEQQDAQKGTETDTETDSEAHSAQALLQRFHTLFSHPYLRIGANESTGMGWFHMHKMEG